jgi:oxaloacetate decarboxylase gamma subunit
MTIFTMLEQSAILTVLGMLVVFVFLWLMIICVNVVGKLISGMGWDKDVYPQKSETPKNTGGTIAPKVTAVISAAVTEYRKQESGSGE